MVKNESALCIRHPNKCGRGGIISKMGELLQLIVLPFHLLTHHCIDGWPLVTL